MVSFLGVRLTPPERRTRTAKVPPGLAKRPAVSGTGYRQPAPAGVPGRAAGVPGRAAGGRGRAAGGRGRMAGGRGRVIPDGRSGRWNPRMRRATAWPAPRAGPPSDQAVSSCRLATLTKITAISGTHTAIAPAMNIASSNIFVHPLARSAPAFSPPSYRKALP